MEKKRATIAPVRWLIIGLTIGLGPGPDTLQALDFLDGIAGLADPARSRLEDSVRQVWAAAESTVLTGADLELLQGVISAGIFEFQDVDGGPDAAALDRIARVAVRAARALEAGLSPPAIEELAQAALGADLSDERFQAAAGVWHRLDRGGVPPGVVRSWLGYALDEGWSAELLVAAGQGVEQAIGAGLDPEQMALALSVAAAQAPPDRSPQAIVQDELDFLQDQTDSAERTRRRSIYQAMRDAIAAGLPRRVAYGLYEHALLEEWPAALAGAVLQGVQQGVEQGLPAENLALALVVRLEQEGRNVPVGRLVDEEIAFVQQKLNLPVPAPVPDSADSSPPVSSPVEPASISGTPDSSSALQPVLPPPETSAASVPPVVAPPAPVAAATADEISWTRLRQSVDSFLGVPYLWGGETRQGTDCSGFTQTVYSEQGVQIPRVSRDQYGFLARRQALTGDRDGTQALRAGDLVFFNKNGRGRITHVGLYMGADKFAHASSSKGVVISDLTVRYYRRLFADGGSVCRVR
ncbi:MAG: hypothetical protein GKR89_12640 [Candidatus Latescibacteria bacterium]|nr:hypothetical protein [Candidatus Latescibacterota bacterium]